MSNIIVVGLTQGHNYPINRTIDLTDCKDIILVDRKYFLQHVEEIIAMAKRYE